MQLKILHVKGQNSYRKSKRFMISNKWNSQRLRVQHHFLHTKTCWTFNSFSLSTHFDSGSPAQPTCHPFSTLRPMASTYLSSIPRRCNSSRAARAAYPADPGENLKEAEWKMMEEINKWSSQSHWQFFSSIDSIGFFRFITFHLGEGFRINSTQQ